MSEVKSRPSVMNRRQFLLAGGVIAAGTCFSGINVREALAESRRLGKPVLTDAAFTERLASLRKGPAFRQEIEDMKRSLPAYLETRYVLNAKQRELIGQVNPKQALELNANLDQALRMNLGVRLQIPSRAECARLQLTFQYTPQELVIVALT
jgi:hypothetical protein